MTTVKMKNVLQTEPIADAQPTVFDISTWSTILRDTPAWQHEIELAAKSKDATKRRHGQALTNFFVGGKMSRQEFTDALYELNGSLMYKVNWEAMKGRLSE